MDVSAREYFGQLAAEQRVTLPDEQELLWQFLASVGMERAFVSFARTELATRYSRLGDYGARINPRYPDSFPPNFQER